MVVAIGLGQTWGRRARQGHNLAHVANYILTSRFILREPVDCTDLAEALEARAWSAGEMDRTGTLGGGPGSAPGERRWAKARWEPDDGACISAYAYDIFMFATKIYVVDWSRKEEKER